MNGAYWGLTTLDLLSKLDTVDVDEVVSWVMECQHESGFIWVLGFLTSIKYIVKLCSVARFMSENLFHITIQ